MNNFVDVYSGEPVVVRSSGSAVRTAVLGYSLLTYVVGMSGLCWLILAMGGLLPYGFGPIQTGSVLSGILVNAGLIGLFGIQHTVMARKPFKRWLVTYLPEEVERPTFVLVSGLIMALIVWCWQPLPGTVWSVEDSVLKIFLYTLFAAGWGYFVLATFVTNHFELFGLRRAYYYFKDVPYVPVQFVNKYMYRYSRHPMMLGILVGMWATPEMSVTHFILALFLSNYIFIGMNFEEKDLLADFGETYREYRDNIGKFFTIK